MPRSVQPPNLAAFLDMLAWSEGTIKFGADDGYNVMVGGHLFNSYADHPRVLVKINDTLYSTAAGRYQELERNYDHYKSMLCLPDFGPVSQDRIAIQQISECRAMPLIANGNLAGAIQACAHIWASLPGAGYNQPENPYTGLAAAYLRAGGGLPEGMPA